MSNMLMLFIDPADRRALPGQPGSADPRTLCGVPGRSAVPPVGGAETELRALLRQRTTEAEELEGFLCSLNLPILHLSADLRLRRFSHAAAQLFGLASADLGGCLDSCWPTAPKLAITEACRSGEACGRVSEGPDGKRWQCRILPRALRHGTPASVIVILLAKADPDPVDQAPAKDKTDLTPRQRQVMDLVLAGHPSKNIAADLKISQRTVENHRAAIMRRTGATSLPALARMAVGASGCADHRLRNSWRALPDLWA